MPTGTSPDVALNQDDPTTVPADSRPSQRSGDTRPPSGKKKDWVIMFDPNIQSHPNWPQTTTGVNILQAIEARARNNVYAYMGNKDLQENSGGKSLRQCQYEFQKLARDGWFKIIYEGPAKRRRMGVVCFRRTSINGPVADTPEVAAQAEAFLRDRKRSKKASKPAKPECNGLHTPECNGLHTPECNGLHPKNYELANNHEEQRIISPNPLTGAEREETIGGGFAGAGEEEAFEAKAFGSCDGADDDGYPDDGADWGDEEPESRPAEPQYDSWPILAFNGENARSLSRAIENLARDEQQRESDGDLNPDEGFVREDFTNDEATVENAVGYLEDLFDTEISRDGAQQRQLSNNRAGFEKLAQGVLERRIAPGAVFFGLSQVIRKLADGGKNPIANPGAYFLRTLANLDSRPDQYDCIETVQNRIRFTTDAFAYGKNCQEAGAVSNSVFVSPRPVGT